MKEYIQGVHCGNDDCYSCTTMKGKCTDLDELDFQYEEELLNKNHQIHM